MIRTYSTYFRNLPTGASIAYTTIVLLFAAALLLVNVLNVVTVYVTLHRHGDTLRFAESILSGVCHRMPSRSFWIAEVPLGLCSRCTGIYGFAFIGLLVSALPKFTLLQRSPKMALVLLLPMILDGLLEHFDLYSGNNPIRFTTGAAFGFCLVAFALDAGGQLIRSFHKQGGTNVTL